MKLLDVLKTIALWPVALNHRMEVIDNDSRQWENGKKELERIGIRDLGVYNVGWIAGPIEHRRRLRKIGVRGRMRHVVYEDDLHTPAAFEYCVASDEVMKRLLVAGWLDYPGAFTKVDLRTGIQLPRRKQTWWPWPSLNGLRYKGFVSGRWY